MKQQLIILLSVIVLIITFQELLYAQCDKKLRSSESEKTGYRIRSHNRCEGFYESDVSSGSLNIVSVTQGKFKFKLDSNEMITVSPIVNNKTVNIRAVAIPLRTYYRMDAQLDPKTNIKWPVADVLYPKKLKDVVRRANIRFAPTLVSDIGWISITTIYPNIYDRLLIDMKVSFDSP